MGKKLAQQNLAKIPKKWGLYRPNRKLAVRLIWQPDRLAVDRPGRPPTVINMTVGQTRSTVRSTAQIQRADFSVTVDRPVDRPDTESKLSGPGRPPRYREQSSLVRSTDRSTGPLCCQTCTALCTSVDRTVDRPLVRSTVRSTDLACQPQSGSGTG